MFEDDTWEKTSWLSGVGLFFEDVIEHVLAVSRRIAPIMPRRFLRFNNFVGSKRL